MQKKLKLQLKNSFFKKINMSDVRKTMKKLRNSNATSYDDISVNDMKRAAKAINPMMLNLINQTFEESEYPENLKITKILPNSKPGKNKLLTEGWRPINNVPAISKPMERIMLEQIIEYMVRNHMINMFHHGNRKYYSTQTLVVDIVDKLIMNLENDIETVIGATDQSKAYNIICHDILEGKLNIIGMSDEAIKLIMNFLKDRKQFVEVNAAASDVLIVGKRLVTQGSALAGLLYQIFTLDIPELFHNTPHDIHEYDDCRETNISTFVDDAFPIFEKKPNMTMAESVQQDMKTLKDYMDSNKLALNTDKTQLMLVSKDMNAKKDFAVEINGKIIKHNNKIKIVGNTINDSLNYESMLTEGADSLLNQLKTRNRHLTYVCKYLDKDMKRKVVNAIFKGKINFGIEQWGGAKKITIDLIDKEYKKATKTALGYDYRDKTHSQRLRELKWLPLDKEIIFATHKATYKILNWKVPLKMSSIMKMNNNHMRIQSQRKLGTKPNILNKNKLTRSTFRNRAYRYNTLPALVTSSDNISKFIKNLRAHMNRMH